MDRRKALMALGALSLGATAATKGPPVGTWVAVMRRGPVFGIDAVMVAPVALRDAWAVLTDFDGMAAFIPNLSMSRIVSHTGERLRVEQQGRLVWGPVDEPFHGVRDVELTPMQSIRSTSIEGALPAEHGLTRVKEVPGGTEIWHRGELAFDSWMPDAVAQRFLERVMAARYQAIAAEMKRRAARAPSQRADPKGPSE
jgi:hypothetical protein